MKQKQVNPWLIGCLTIAIMLLFAAMPSFRTYAQTTDKSKSGKEQPSKTNDSGSKSATKHSGNKNSEIDEETLNKAIHEVQRAMQKLQNEELPKIEIEIRKAMKEIDAAKIARETAMAMRQVDMEKVKAEIKRAMNELDDADIDVKVKAAIEKIDMKKLQLELERTEKELKSGDLDIQMKKLHEQMEHVHVDVKKQLEKAGEQLKKAEAQLQLMKEGLKELENDGLIKKGEKVSVEYKDDILYINGKAQSKEVSEKYKKYFNAEHGRYHMNLNDNDNDSRLVK